MSNSADARSDQMVEHVTETEQRSTGLRRFAAQFVEAFRQVGQGAETGRVVFVYPAL